MKTFEAPLVTGSNLILVAHSSRKDMEGHGQTMESLAIEQQGWQAKTRLV